MSSEEDRYVDRAIQWALERLGSPDYETLCLGFIEDAYEKANGIVLDGYPDAGEAATGYGAEDDGRVPPKGGLVFYDGSGTINGKYKNWGHVGLSLGDGRVVHAWDIVRVDGYLDVQGLVAAGWTPLRYAGWAPASRVLARLKPGSVNHAEASGSA